MAAIKQNNLQIIQSFAYSVAEDVAYNLLNICKQFAMPVEEVQLQICGMIDTESGMYAEVKKYFEHLTVQNVPTILVVEDSLSQHPAHYFTPFFNLAL